MKLPRNTPISGILFWVFFVKLCHKIAILSEAPHGFIA